MNATEQKLRDTLSLKIDGEGRIDYCVKAGAGAGKTTQLGNRITAQILEGTDIEDFAVITYTNAAAAELREKISLQLQSVIDAAAVNADKMNRAKDALNRIELMQISTIHALLLKLLRENALEANVVLDVRMLEDYEDVDRRERFFNKWYHEHFDEIQNFADDWIHVTNDGRKQEKVRDVFLDMFKVLANVREEVIFDTANQSLLIESYARDYVAKWIGPLKTVRDCIKKELPNPKGGERKLNKEAGIVVDSVDKVELAGRVGIKEAEALSEAITNVYTIKDKGKNIFFGCKITPPDIDTAMDFVFENLPENELEWNFSEYLKIANKAQAASKVAEYVCTMQKTYQKEIDEETRYLSNDDILFRAFTLLKNNADILDKIRARYKKIYVDEFQDTTRVQTKIIMMLSERVGSKPLSKDLEVGKLVIVGDSKQSIYRFTGAEKAVFDEMDNFMNNGLPDTVAESVSLSTNFRSNEAIVEWVNKCFSKLMSNSGYEAIETDWKVMEEKALHGVFRYDSKPVRDADDKDSDYSKASDVEAVAGLVQRLVENDHCFVEECNRNADGTFGAPALRSIQYSDIMIICKYTTNMSSYVKKFASLGIPVNVNGKFKVNNDAVLRNFITLLEYFAEPKNKINRLAAVQACSGMDITKAAPQEIKTYEDSFRYLNRYFKERRMDAAAITQYLLSQEEMYFPKSDQPLDKSDVRSYRIHIHQMVESCLQKNDGDLRTLVGLMKDYIEQDVKREIPLESNENAIRLMNVHQSKGLTGQIVIIADRSSNEKCHFDGFKKDDKYYPAASYKMNNNSSGQSYPCYAADVKKLDEVYNDEKEEAIRLQYVAATRAAQALIIMPPTDRAKKPWFSSKEYGYNTLTDINVWLRDREADSTQYPLTTVGKASSNVVLKLDDLRDSKELANANADALNKTQVISITPSSLEPAGVSGYAPMDAGYNKEDRPSGNVFGTVMHRCYELIIRNYESLYAMADAEREKAIIRFINMAILEQRDEMRAEDKPQEFKDFLKPVFVRHLHNLIPGIMNSAAEVYPEFSFSFFVPEEEKASFLTDFEGFFRTAKDAITVDADKIWINGQADLVVKQKDGSIKVFDYKSDGRNGKPLDLFEKSLAQKYEGQLALYRYAIGKAFHTDTVQTELIHLYRP